MKTPVLKPRVVEVELGYVNRLLGLQLTPGEVKALLERMRYGVSGKEKLLVEVPSYRTDVLHPMDVVEDVAIAYGYEKFVPEEFRGYTSGGRDEMEAFSSTLRDVMVGLGFQEVMTLVLTNRTVLFGRMNVAVEAVVETTNPVSMEHSVARSWMLPSLLTVLEKNRTQEYPQRIFEVGDCLNQKGVSSVRLAGAIAHSTTSFSEVKAVVDGLLETLGLKYIPKEMAHGSFIKGRCVDLGFGFYGEVSPVVLEGFHLKVPVSAFEMDAGLMAGLLNK